MYEFRDTTDFTSVSYPLPSEAMSIDGYYIENLIDGYRTLYTRGRETLSPEIERGEVGVRDGSYIKNKRFPARKITVGYQLIASTPSTLMTAFRQLNDILNVEDAQLIFADETDKYITGTPSGFADVPSGGCSIKSEFEIICDDPFFYSVTEYEVEPTEDSNTTFVVSYAGTYPSYPVLEAHFYESETAEDTNGNCGFVAFSTQNADVLQFGTATDPDEINEAVTDIMDGTETTWTESECLVNESFNALTNWSNNDGYTGSIYNLASGTPAVGYIKNGTNKAMYVSDYGSGAQWHGATVKRTIPADSGNPSVTGAVDWAVHGTMRFAPNSTAKTAKKQTGMISIAVTNANGLAIAGFTVFKKKGTNKGTIKCIVNNKTVKTFKNVNLSYYNGHFGYKKKSTSKRPCNYDITKSGSKFTFNLGGSTFSYKLSSLADAVAKHVSIYIAKWGDTSAVSWMGVYGCQFTSTSVTQTYSAETWSELTETLEAQNVFTTNDILVADCSDGSIRLMNAYATEEVDGGLHPEYGALGNDWESFVLTQGTNQIGTMYSDWVADAYAPTFVLRYRERYL